jgi:hypothetical protein
MYEHRYQRQLGQALGLAWRIFSERGGGVRVLFFYGLMHLAGVLDRRGLRHVADLVRRWLSVERVERACGALLRGSFRFVVTGIGGCALDVDNEHDLDVARQRFAVWERELARVAEAQQGPLELPAEAGAGTAPCGVLPPGPQA